MMEAVAKTSSNITECEISLEERMACGVKACVGCSIKLRRNEKVCHDGPVFKSETIVDLEPAERTETCCGN